MIALDYFLWWYSGGFLRLLKYLKSFIIILADNFSVGILVRTFFQPWKRDVTSTKGLSLDKIFRIWGWNLISRGFGMVIKSFTFLLFLAIFLSLIVFEFLAIIIWLLYPLVMVVGLVYSFYRAFNP